MDLIVEYGGWIAVMAVTGLVAGFVAGLLGVGGGIVIVPVPDIALAAFGRFFPPHEGCGGHVARHHHGDLARFGESAPSGRGCRLCAAQELGSVLVHPQHEYTRRLIAAVPSAMERIRRRLKSMHDGDRQMVEILSAVLTDGIGAVDAACQEALDHGVCSSAVIINILTPEALRLRHEPQADCARYDSLRRAS